MKMFRFAVIASILSAAYASSYAYFDNNVVEYGGASSAQAISLPYVYQEPNLIKIGQRPSTVDTIYEVRNPVVPVLETQEIGLSPFSLICSIVTSIIGCVKRGIVYIITSIPTLVFSFLGLCNMTSLWNYFNMNSFLNVSDLTTFVTPERLKRATDFVETAIRKYRSLKK